MSYSHLCTPSIASVVPFGDSSAHWELVMKTRKEKFMDTPNHLRDALVTVMHTNIDPAPNVHSVLDLIDDMEIEMPSQVGLYRDIKHAILDQLQRGGAGHG